MDKSQVFFTDMRCKNRDNLLIKLGRLMDRAGIGQIDFERKFTAVKIHFGEPGNLAFLRPNFAKTVADKVKQLGGRPFLTDCNTLYVGRRKDALEHLDAAMENGFSPLSTGCQMLIGDGLKGTDDIEVPVPNGEYCRTARIGRAVMDADVFISLTHFKCHEATGIGGALKNIGMGCGSRAGKMQMHNDGKPIADPQYCKACGRCANYCAQDAIQFGPDGKAFIDHDRCVGCGRCIGVCNFSAIYNRNAAAGEMLDCKIAEYTAAVLAGRPHFHVCIVNQVSPYCDCHAENDAAIVPDIGMFASFDPVALDAAASDAVNAAPKLPGTRLAEQDDGHHDHLTGTHPTTNWRAQLQHGQKIGLGSMEYELVTV